jgi:hypothetical protein
MYIYRKHHNSKQTQTKSGLRKTYFFLKIKIGHDNSKPFASWFLDEVRIDIPSRGEQYVFACHRWLGKDSEDGNSEIEIEPSFKEDREKSKFSVNQILSVFVLSSNIEFLEHLNIHQFYTVLTMSTGVLWPKTNKTLFRPVNVSVFI